MKAIERIAGYACEVNEGQWRELVKVAYEVKAKIFDRRWPNETGKLFVSVYSDGDIIKDSFIAKGLTLIPYPDFLAKLKGEEKWEPKNGEEVEVLSNLEWVKANYIGKNGHYFVVDRIDLDEYKEYMPTEIRQADLRPTVSRAEAERKLKELGVIARIVD